jgi:hypothetical protein
MMDDKLWSMVYHPSSFSYGIIPPQSIQNRKSQMTSSSFQTIILKLQNFWAEHGCLITQPYWNIRLKG